MVAEWLVGVGSFILAHILIGFAPLDMSWGDPHLVVADYKLKFRGWSPDQCFFYIYVKSGKFSRFREHFEDFDVFSRMFNDLEENFKT